MAYFYADLLSKENSWSKVGSRHVLGDGGEPTQIGHGPQTKGKLLTEHRCPSWNLNRTITSNRTRGGKEREMVKSRETSEL